MRVCPECGNEIAIDTGSCPHCVDGSESAKMAKSNSRKKCPECGSRLKEGALSCDVCGLIFFTKPAKPLQTPERPPQLLEKRASPSPVAVLLIAAAIVVLTIYYLPEIRSVFAGNRSIEPRAIRALPSDFTEFDLEIDLDARPSGLVWNEKEFVAGNNDAGTFIRVRHTGDQFVLREQSVARTAPMTWNGNQLIGFTESGLLQSFKKYQFTVHAGATLNLEHQNAAPEPIGGVAWDGSGYWAATRKENEADRGFIFRLDPDFKLVNKLVAPSSRCRGLAWDGTYLWFLDDNDDKVYILDVMGIQARVLGSYELPLDSARGIAFDGRSIWIADHDLGRLLRMNSDLSARWTQQQADSTRSKGAQPRSASSNFAEYSMPKSRANGDIYIASFSAKMESNVLYASWDIEFGPNLLKASNSPRRKPASFGKLTVTVDGEPLSSPAVRVFDANEGRNFADRVPILTDVSRGKYNVRALLYIEYTDRNGIGRILSKPIPSLSVSN
jgi:hypothetical protein